MPSPCPQPWPRCWTGLPTRTRWRTTTKPCAIACGSKPRACFPDTAGARRASGPCRSDARSGQALEDLARVEDALRVHRPLDLAHQVDHVVAELGDQLLALAHADAVLTRARALQTVRMRDHPVVDALGGLAFGGVVRIDQEQHVVIAVAHVAEDRCGEPGG